MPTLHVLVSCHQADYRHRGRVGPQHTMTQPCSTTPSDEWWAPSTDQKDSLINGKELCMDFSNNAALTVEQVSSHAHDKTSLLVKHGRYMYICMH
jgi:hypothetical protein